MGYRKGRITSYTKGRWGMCYKIRENEVGVAYINGGRLHLQDYVLTVEKNRRSPSTHAPTTQQ